MASSAGQATLNGRFPKGTIVSLWKVKDETVLRHEGGKLVDTKKVDDDGRVQFKSGVEVGARYFAFGYVDGQPVEVRLTGRSADDDSAVLAQAPIRAERVRLGNGAWSDEVPDREAAGGGWVGPGPSQSQVPKGTPQRSDTPLGQGTPVDPAEQVPFPRQEDVAKGTPQMSDTRTGAAAPVVVGAPQSQEDAKGILQRSDTPHGTTTPVPAGDAVAAVQARESSDAKAARGEPGKAAAEPLDAARGTTARAAKTPAKRKAPARRKASGASRKKPAKKKS